MAQEDWWDFKILVQHVLQVWAQVPMQVYQRGSHNHARLFTFMGSLAQGKRLSLLLSAGASGKKNVCVPVEQVNLGFAAMSVETQWGESGHLCTLKYSPFPPAVNSDTEEMEFKTSNQFELGKFKVQACKYIKPLHSNYSWRSPHLSQKLEHKRRSISEIWPRSFNAHNFWDCIM